MTEADLVIIGAGRSGTNALRDVLCKLEGYGTWPCDEINYIWRHGNRDLPTDAFERSHATAEVADYIRSAFRKQRATLGDQVVVEKTCANSLRVGFVDEVLTDARFFAIERDPVDVVASAMKRWTAPLDIPYVLRKARFVPPSDVAYYAWRYLNSRIARLQSDESRLSTWGPRFPGMDQLIDERADLHVVCAHQWKACVTRSRSQLQSVSDDRVAVVQYHELVEAPVDVVTHSLTTLGLPFQIPDLASAVGSLHAGSVGKGYGQLTAKQIDDILAICADV